MVTTQPINNPPASNSTVFGQRTISSAGVPNGPALAFDASGYLYMPVGGQLYQVNPSTGVSTNQGSITQVGGTNDAASCSYPTTVSVLKNIAGRVASTDQFTVTVTGGGLATGNSGTTNSTGDPAPDTGLQSKPEEGVQPVLALPGTSYTFTETAATTTPATSLANYTSAYRCVDSANGNAVVVPTTSGTSVSYTPTAGQQIVCTFTNTPLASNINLAKTAGTVSGPDSSGVFTATYDVTAENTGNGAATYGPLVDTPGFDANFTVTGASWTGASTGSVSGTGPFTLAPSNTTIAAGATATYHVSITFTYTGSGTPTACDGSSGQGLYNSVAATGETGPTGDNSACLPPPVPADVFLQKNSAGTGTALAGSSWQLQADNGGSPGTVLPGTVNPVSGQTGEFKMSNLLPGTYWLTETTAPHGYELLAQPIEFKVAMDGIVTLIGADPAVTLGSTSGGATEIRVADVAAIALPYLGGSGTTAYTLAGVGLIGLAGCALVLRRRTNADRAPRGKRARP